MATDPWADVPSGDYWKPVKVGDRIAGTIVGVGLGKDFDGQPCPQLVIDTKEGHQTVTCGQANLKAKVMALAPRPKGGDQIAITFSAEKPTGKGSPLKEFEVVHKVNEPVPAEDLF